MLKFHSSKRAKPQNRTEVSPTTMECSTVELELPFVYLISFSTCFYFLFSGFSFLFKKGKRNQEKKIKKEKPREKRQSKGDLKPKNFWIEIMNPTNKLRYIGIAKLHQQSASIELMIRILSDGDLLSGS